MHTVSDYAISKHSRKRTKTEREARRAGEGIQIKSFLNSLGRSLGLRGDVPSLATSHHLLPTSLSRAPCTRAIEEKENKRTTTQTLERVNALSFLFQNIFRNHMHDTPLCSTRFEPLSSPPSMPFDPSAIAPTYSAASLPWKDNIQRHPLPVISPFPTFTLLHVHITTHAVTPTRSTDQSNSFTDDDDESRVSTRSHMRSPPPTPDTLLSIRVH